MLTKPDLGTLYVVALPIGNAMDITLRALEILKNVDYIAAEDTRNTKLILSQLGIHCPQILSHHNYNEEASSQKILDFFKAKKSVALVCDAGTPGICDPGYHLVRLAIENKIPVKTIPGPSSLSAALSICGIGGTTHWFGGFAPNQAKDRIALFAESHQLAHRIVFFESPHRLLDHLQNAEPYFPEVSVLREMTKSHEEIFLGSVQSAFQYFSKTDVRGECVIVYAQAKNQKWEESKLLLEINSLLDQNLSRDQLLDKLREESFWSKKEIYKLVELVKQTRKK